MELAYLGPLGTFSEMAARAYRKRRGEPLTLVPVRSIPDILLAVNQGTYPLGIVPVENSIEGSIVVTLDMLVHEVELKIVAEQVVPVRHHLLARPGVQAAQIQRVISHPQALGQCRRTLQRIVPQAEVQRAHSTAEAAQQVASTDEPWAAVGTELAGEIYGLAKIAENIQDFEENTTRFVVVGHEEPAPTGWDKTSIAFAFAEDRPGNLYHALKEFAERDVNLTKLESRPAKRSLGDYLFFVDMEGHRSEKPIQEILENLQAMSAHFRFLGSYPRVNYFNGTDRADGHL